MPPGKQEPSAPRVVAPGRVCISWNAAVLHLESCPGKHQAEWLLRPLRRAVTLGSCKMLMQRVQLLKSQDLA